MGEISVIPSHPVTEPSEEEKKREKRLKSCLKYFKVKSFGKKKPGIF